jgi:copper homeostasis protein
MTPRLEVCVDSVEGALAAQEGGAHRVELCAALFEGGLTPSAAAITLARRHLQIDLNVIIRPRGGDFCYSELEFEVMREDVQVAKRLGANGVVLGLLREDGAVDVERTRRLVETARPLSVTFHRAFDMTRAPFAALEELVELGIDRLLTSGQESSALAGIDLLRDLVRAAGDRILVLVGGDINERNLEKILRETQAREVHVTAWKTRDSPMSFRNERLFMGGELRPSEFSRRVTDAGRVRALVERLKF